MGVSGGVATGVLASEVCAPLLLLCWLCCWPDDGKSDTSSSGKHPRKPIVANESSSHRPRRSSDLITRRIGSSVASLHLPSTSGHSKEPLSAHRSHEEIPNRRRSNLEIQEEARYHSAPSVIHEVLHRRDWERSTKDLYIPLKPEAELQDIDNDSELSNSPEAPHAEPESSSIEGFRSDERLGPTCKKHYTNIKSSRNRTKKEATRDDVKDTDATESSLSNFFIGDAHDNSIILKNEDLNNDIADDKLKSVYKAKDAKQSFNESIKTKERPKMSIFEDSHFSFGNSEIPLKEYETNMYDIDLDLFVDELDRSGAMHHSEEPRSSFLSCVSKPAIFPPPSVEAVGYEGGACYLAETGHLRAVRGPWGGPPGAAGGPRARHASDGDILAPTHRPESGAFSESDLDLEVESGDERPPPYDELQQYTRPDRKETAI